MTDHISTTEENYLKALFKLANGEGMVNISELSAALQVSKPTANSMVKKLSAQGWLVYEKYRPLTMTEEGRLRASSIIRKHRLTEMYLVEKMGFSWEIVHEIAEQVEHVQSNAFFDRMDEMLGFPKFDPHGSPIPDKEGNTAMLDLIRLSDFEPHQSGVLYALADSRKELLNFLNGKSIAIGLKINILSKEAFDGSMTISYDGHPQVVISQMVSDQLMLKID